MKAEVHFLNCGDGDTILVRGGDEWGLIDCNFVKGSGTKERAERLLEGVDRLRFVCVSHFDLDHIRGMETFLRKHYCDEDADGRLHWRIDQIILPVRKTSLGVMKSLRDFAAKEHELMTADSTKPPWIKGDIGGETMRLFEMFWEMLEGRYGRKASAGGRTFPEFVYLIPGEELLATKWRTGDAALKVGPWRCIALGPAKDTGDVFNARLESLFRSPGPERDAERAMLGIVSSNSSSRVLALLHTDSREAVLLTGDSEPVELRAALKEWDRIPVPGGRAVPNYRCVKVSHHGAQSCHVEEMYHQPHMEPPSSEAVISASGRGEHHPHPTVIQCLKGRGLEYRVTGNTRAGKGARTTGLAVPMGYDLVVPDGRDITLSRDGAEFRLD